MALNVHCKFCFSCVNVVGSSSGCHLLWNSAVVEDGRARVRACVVC